VSPPPSRPCRRAHAGGQGLGGSLQASECATRELEARVDEKAPGVARIIHPFPDLDAYEPA
jgi:hypothetical protein